MLSFRFRRSFPLAAALLLLVLLTLLTSPAAAQEGEEEPVLRPLGAPFLLTTAEPGLGPARVTALPSGGGFAAAWRYEYRGFPFPYESLLFQRLDLDGAPVEPREGFGSDSIVARPRIDGLQADEVVVGWSGADDDSMPCARYQLHRDGTGPLEEQPEDTVVPCDPALAEITDLEIAVLRPQITPRPGRGQLVVAVARHAMPDAPPELQGGITISRYTATGSPATGGARVPDSEQVLDLALAVDPRGRALVVWSQPQPGGGTGVYHQLFGPQGPLSSLYRAGIGSVGTTVDAMALAGPDGGFVVAWRGPVEDDGPDAGTYQVLGQKILANGRPLALTLDLSGDRLPAGADGNDPEGRDLGPTLAAGPGGRFAAGWVVLSDDGTTDRLVTRLFAFDGEPVGPTVEVASIGTATARLRSPDLAWSWRANRLLASWQESYVSSTGDPSALKARLLQTSAPAGHDELCVLRGNRLACSSVADRPDPKGLGFAFGTGTEAPLLTDLDGDGRDDLCLRADRTFRCDLAHDGIQREADTINFGGGQGIPLGADADGDGRGEICLHAEDRTNLVVCDSAQDGRFAETFLAFGPRTARPFLGDTDGDGKDELCLVIDGTLRCDTAQNGGGAELIRPVHSAVLAAFLAGGKPLLADLDGDGADHLCVTRVDDWLCDLDGFVVSVPIPGGDLEPGDAVLVGDVDGL